MSLAPLSNEELYDADTLGMEWVEYLRFAVATGMVLVMDESDPESDEAKMGYMRKDGREWRWEQQPSQSFLQRWKRRGPLLRREPAPEVDMGNLGKHIREGPDEGMGCRLC